MNLGHLHDVFRNYINKFEEINRPDGDHEVYKWYAIKDFSDALDLDVPDNEFPEMLHKARKASINLVDGGGRTPFYGLCKIAESDPASVRTLMKMLFESDGGDLEKRQRKINAFVNSAYLLKEKYYPGSFYYLVSQHTAMILLWMYDPDTYYWYKASEALDLAECLEFYDDWGPYHDFDLKTYHRFCDKIIEESKKDDALLKTHMSRFENDAALMHQDKELHILLADICFCYSRYLNEGIKITPMTSSVKKEYLKNKEIALRLLEEHRIAHENLTNYETALSKFSGLIDSGYFVTHKAFGTGEVKAINNGFCTIYFPEKDKELKRPFLKTIGTGNLIINSPEFDNLFSEYKFILTKDETSLRKQAEITANRLTPYEKYID